MEQLTRIDSRTREESALHTDSAHRYRTRQFPLSPVPWHWHSEVELFFVPEGAMTCVLPEGEYLLQAGDVGFINSGVLHRVFPAARGCTLQNHIFLPRMIAGGSAETEARYIAPLLHNRAAAFLHFPAHLPETARLRGWMEESHQAHTRRTFAHELIVRDCMSRVWALLAETMPAPTVPPSPQDPQRLMRMLQYISEHYGEKITLQQLADAAHISSKECERCFRKQIRMSPFAYLMDYRLEKTRELLLREGSITEIGQRCGFGSTSYFVKCFREKFGLTPGAFRRSGPS